MNTVMKRGRAGVWGRAATARATLAGAVCAAAILAAGPVAAQSVEALTQKNQQLEAAMRDLLQEVQILKNQMRTTAADAAAAREAASNPAAPAKMVTSGNKDVSLSVSGQVNRGMLYANDGNAGKFYSVDNDASSTRVRFDGKGRVDDELSVGTRIEVQFESNSTADVNQLSSDESATTDNFTQRKLELWFAHKRFGKLSLGQGDTASNGMSEFSLSGTDLVNYVGVADMAGGMLFSFKDNNVPGRAPVSVAGSPTVGSAFNQLDGHSRQDRIRYDTPSYEGAALATSLISGGRKWDVAGTYGASFFDQLDVQAGIGFAHDGDADNRVHGSGTVLHTPTGISFTWAQGVEFDLANNGGTRRNDQNFRYAQLGWQWPIFSFGKTYTAVDFFENTDVATNGDYGQAYGVGIVQKIDSAATEIYLGARNYHYDRTNANFSDIQAVLTGARVKF